MKIKYHFLLTVAWTLCSLLSVAQLKIVENGNVGIGTTAPDKTLEIQTPSGTETALRLRQLTQNYWDFKIPTSGTRLDIGDVSGTNISLLNGGFVGVGYTADPTSSNKFAVNGNSYFGGSFNAKARQLTDWNVLNGYETFVSSEGSTSNAPSTDYTYGIRLKFHRDENAYYTDLVTSLYSDRLFFRRRADGGFQTWKELIHTGNIGSQSVDKVDGLHAGELVPYGSSRDFTQGTLIQTDIDYSQTNGDAFLIEIEGNSYFQLIPINTKIQGYIWDNTIISKGVLSSGYQLTGIVGFNYNGKLCFWFPNQGYWHGYNVFAQVVTGAGIKKNRLVSITNEAKPGGITKEVSFDNSEKQALFKTIGDSLHFLRADGSTSLGAMIYPSGDGIAIKSGSGWGASITNNSAHWNSAYSAIYSTSLTSGYIPKWNGSYLVNSLYSDNGTSATVSGNLMCTNLNTGAITSSAGIQASGSVETYSGDFSTISGDVYCVNLYESSDQNIKTNIVDLTSSSDKLFSLRPVAFNFLMPSPKTPDTQVHMGFIAQEVQKIFPDIVSENKNGLLSISYTQLIPVLVQTVKEQSDQIKSLEDRIVKLESLIK